MCRGSCSENRHTCALLNAHQHKHCHETQSYISINTPPSCSPSAVPMIGSLILICRIPSGSHHWRVSLRVKNTMLSCLVPSLAFPTPRLKIALASTDHCALAKIQPHWHALGPKHPVTASSGPQTQMCLSPSHQCQSLGLIAKPRNTGGWCTSASWCQWWWDEWRWKPDGKRDSL